MPSGEGVCISGSDIMHQYVLQKSVWGRAEGLDAGTPQVSKRHDDPQRSASATHLYSHSILTYRDLGIQLNFFNVSLIWSDN